MWHHHQPQHRPVRPTPRIRGSGLRIGTSALATRGFGPKEYEEVADIIGTALAAGQDADVDALKRASTSLPKTSRFTRDSTKSTDHQPRLTKSRPAAQPTTRKWPSLPSEA